MSDGIIKKIQLPNGNIYDIQSEIVTDLGVVDPEPYDDDISLYLNTLTESGFYKFFWDNGDDYSYFAQVQSITYGDAIYVNQHCWGLEENPITEWTRGIIIEDGEVVSEESSSYMTFDAASSTFAMKTHQHYRTDSKALSVFDYCDGSQIKMQNGSPILYTDTLNSRQYVIETWQAIRQPTYNYQRVTDLIDSGVFYQRSGLYQGGVTHWSNWKTYPSNSVTDVLVNNSSVVNNGIASLPAIPSKTSDLTNDSGFITGYTETDPTVPAWAKASTKPSYNFSEIGSTPTTISGYGLTDAYTKTEVDNLLLALPEPMLFKGSLGTGGTITTLPAAAVTNEGFVYKVITDGTYASQSAKIGDTFISDGSTWVLIPSGDEPSGTVTSVGISNATNGGLSISNSPITSSGTISIGHSNVLASAQTTLGVYPIKIDKNGHISEYGNAVTIPTKVSDLTNDAGYLTSYTETDPTVPSWAKASSKPSYTAAEVGAVPITRTVNGKVLSTDIILSASDVSALPSSTVIPSKTSDITNDSGFITSPNVVYCTCATGKDTAAKVATIVSGTLTSLNVGDQAIVKFTSSNTSASPTLKIGDTDAKQITRYGSTIPSASTDTSWNAGSPILFVYDGTYWVMVGWLNSVYSEISEANIINATSSAAGLITGRRAKKAVETFAPVTSVNGQTGAVTISADSIFYAEYEVTSYADIKAALDAGKEVILVDDQTSYGGDMCNFYGLAYHTGTSYASGSNYMVFTNDSTSYWIKVDESNTWDSGNFQYNSIKFTDYNTYALTLQAPSAISSSNKTITLPDKSGTIALTGDIPTVPTKTSDLTNDSGFITSYTDEKVKAESTSDGTTYYPVMGGSSGNAETKKYSSALRFEEDTGYALLEIGKSSKKGELWLHTGNGNLDAIIQPNTSMSSSALFTLPSTSGTLALTSDIPTKTSDLTNDSGFTTQTIYASTVAPTSADGEDGDVWFIYTPSV